VQVLTIRLEITDFDTYQIHNGGFSSRYFFTWEM